MKTAPLPLPAFTLYALHLTLQLRCLSPLILHRIVRFNGFGLDDDSRIASGEGTAFGGDGSGDIAGRQSECHGDSRGNGQCQVLDGFHEPLFLGFG